MEVKINSKILKKEIDKISKVFKKDNKFHMARALSITGYKDGLLLSARSGEIFAKVFIKCEVTDPCFFSVDGFQFSGFLKTIESDDIKIKFDPSKEMILSMTTKSVRSKLKILDPEIHPFDIDYDTVKFYKVPNFFTSIEKVKFSASNDNTKAFLKSVMINNSHAVSTDSFMLGYSDFKYTLPFKALLPIESIGIIPDYIKNAKEIEVAFTSDDGYNANMLHVKNENTVFTIRLLDCTKYVRYPDILNRIKTYQNKMTINPQVFTEALRTARSITDNNERIEIMIYENGIKFSFENDAASFERFIEVGEVFSNPDKLSACFYVKLDIAIDFFNAASSSTNVDLLIKSSMDPMFIVNGDDVFVAMPLKPQASR